MSSHNSRRLRALRHRHERAEQRLSDRIRWLRGRTLPLLSDEWVANDRAIRSAELALDDLIVAHTVARHTRAVQGFQRAAGAPGFTPKERINVGADTAAALRRALGAAR